MLNSVILPQSQGYGMGTSCSHCGGASFISDYQAGEMICVGCGLVISDKIIDTGPEWRAFSYEEISSRSRASGVNSPILEKTIPTRFTGIRDGTGKLLDAKTLAQMNRLKTYDNRSRRDDTLTRNLSIAMTELDRLSAILQLPELIKNQAAQIYRKALENDMIRGRSIDAFIAASIYAACRIQKMPRSLKMISEVSNRDYSAVARTYRLIIRLLEIRIPIDDSLKFVTGIASKLELEPSTERRAVEILRVAKIRQGLSGKEPRGVAAAALYIACLETDSKRTQKEFAVAAGTTEVTLRNRMKGLKLLLGGVLASDSSPMRLVVGVKQDNS